MLSILHSSMTWRLARCTGRWVHPRKPLPNCLDAAAHTRSSTVVFGRLDLVLPSQQLLNDLRGHVLAHDVLQQRQTCAPRPLPLERTFTGRKKKIGNNASERIRESHLDPLDLELSKLVGCLLALCCVRLFLHLHVHCFRSGTCQPRTCACCARMACRVAALW